MVLSGLCWTVLDTLQSDISANGIFFSAKKINRPNRPNNQCLSVHNCAALISIVSSNQTRRHPQLL